MVFNYLKCCCCKREEKNTRVILTVKRLTHLTDEDDSSDVSGDNGQFNSYQ